MPKQRERFWRSSRSRSRVRTSVRFFGASIGSVMWSAPRSLRSSLKYPFNLQANLPDFCQDQHTLRGPRHHVRQCPVSDIFWCPELRTGVAQRTLGPAHDFLRMSADTVPNPTQITKRRTHARPCIKLPILRTKNPALMAAVIGLSDVLLQLPPRLSCLWICPSIN